MGNRTYLKCELTKKECEDREPRPRMVHYGECGNCSPKNVCHWMRGELNKNIWAKRPSVLTLMVLLQKKIWIKSRTRASDGRVYDKCEFQVARCEKFNSDGEILQSAHEIKFSGTGNQKNKLETNSVNR